MVFFSKYYYWNFADNVFRSVNTNRLRRKQSKCWQILAEILFRSVPCLSLAESCGCGEAVRLAHLRRLHGALGPGRRPVSKAGGVTTAATAPQHAAVAGCGKLYRARSRLYRSQILQENMRLKAIAEIYTIHSFALL